MFPFAFFGAVLALGSAAAAQPRPADALDCALCHHPAGQPDGAAGLAYAPYPQIAGLPARYIAQQLRAYRSGARPHALMGYVASRLSDEEIAEWAQAYAAGGRPVQHVRRAPEAGEGERVAVFGVWERGVPPCQSCHASEGDRPPGAPVLAGMGGGYILGELRAYASGERGGGGLGRMQAYADRLTDAEMAAVAAWYAGADAETLEASR